jgi:hypothetical protein
MPAMTWARICSVRGALARRNLSYLSITRIATHGLEGCDQQSSESMRCKPLWKRYASGFEGGGSDDSRNNNGGSGDSEEKGQWRQWVEQRLKGLCIFGNPILPCISNLFYMCILVFYSKSFVSQIYVLYDLSSKAGVQ